LGKLLGSRGASAVLGFFALVLTPTDASAQAVQAVSATTAVNAGSIDTTATPLGKSTPPVVSAIGKAVTSGAATVSAALTTVMAGHSKPPAGTLTAKPEIAREAAWLYANGWPPVSLVERYANASGPALDEQANCIAVAVYHEARGESVEGQLAVARVIMNRAASGKYPASWCGAVKQPWQFSFVNPRTGEFPYTDMNSNSWRKAVAVTRLAVSNAIPTLSNDVLWYHADYVAPSWGRRLTRVNKIGTHIFYRA